MYAVQTTKNGELHRIREFETFEEAQLYFVRRAIIVAASKGKAPADLLRSRALPAFTWGDLKIEIIPK